MQKLVLSLILSLGLQQPKAYDLVHYTARVDEKVFKLDYADGYPAASRITLIEPGHKTLTFMPDDSIFSTPGSKARIILGEVDGQAPVRILAKYKVAGKVFNVWFKR